MKKHIFKKNARVMLATIAIAGGFGGINAQEIAQSSQMIESTPGYQHPEMQAAQHRHMQNDTGQARQWQSKYQNAQSKTYNFVNKSNKLLRIFLAKDESKQMPADFCGFSGDAGAGFFVLHPNATRRVVVQCPVTLIEIKAQERADDQWHLIKKIEHEVNIPSHTKQEDAIIISQEEAHTAITQHQEALASQAKAAEIEAAAQASRIAPQIEAEPTTMQEQPLLGTEGRQVFVPEN